MTFDEIVEYIGDWLVNVSDLPASQVISANQNAPKPDQDFLTLNDSVNIMNSGEAQKTYNEDVITITQPKFAAMSLNCYGPNALSIMMKIQDKLDSPETLDYFDQNDITIIPASPIRNMTFIEENQYQDRRQFDLKVMFVVIHTENVGYFDSVGLKSDELYPDYEIENHSPLSLELSIETEDSEVIQAPIVESRLTHEIDNTNRNENIIELNLEKDFFLVENSEKIVDVKITLENEFRNHITSNNSQTEPEITIDIEHLFINFTDLTANDESGHYPLFELEHDRDTETIFSHSFTEILSSIQDTSDNNNDLIEVIHDRSLDRLLFEHPFIENDVNNDISANNNDLIEVNNNRFIDHRFFEHLFLTNFIDEDSSPNNNDLIEVNR